MAAAARASTRNATKTTNAQPTIRDAITQVEKEAAASASTMTQVIELLVCTALIYIIYLTYGFYHEKIPNHNYGTVELPEKFKFPMFLTAAQCLGNSIWALVLFSYDAVQIGKKPAHAKESFLKRMKDQIFDKVPKIQYVIIATSYALSMLSSTAALTYLSYLIQALAKSSKLVPVMAGKMIHGHRYSLREYFHVALITGGIVLFVFDPNKSSKAATSVWGICLIVFSLSMDAITGPTQDAINAKYKPTVAAMTFWINILPAMAFGAYCFISGELGRAISFIAQHPGIRFEIAIYCFLASIGQTLILIALFKFDSMTLTVITTTRKFFSILGSVFWFGHSLQSLQWLGVVMVFVGIGADSHLKWLMKHQKKAKKTDEVTMETEETPSTSKHHKTEDESSTLTQRRGTNAVGDQDDETTSTAKSGKVVAKSKAKVAVVDEEEKTSPRSSRSKKVVDQEDDSAPQKRKSTRSRTTKEVENEQDAVSKKNSKSTKKAQVGDKQEHVLSLTTARTATRKI